ncbi:hypothetical protein BJX63DRAFT_27990 [Aspergillus granulosus]|uniref:Myb-like DNA-binding domain-containing protein n=1 Tax=Aspergillus granulosus TaxID=176169 RepID=A0ABR4HUE0_9EURO
MPAKSYPESSVMLLYLCIVHSNLTKIDFNAVGETVDLTREAARLRYGRLKKQLENEIGDGKVNLKRDDGASGPAVAPPTGTGDSIEDDEDLVPAPTSTSPRKKRKAAVKSKVKAEKTDTIGVDKASKKMKVAKEKGLVIKQEYDDEDKDCSLMGEEMDDVAA